MAAVASADAESEARRPTDAESTAGNRGGRIRVPAKGFPGKNRGPRLENSEEWKVKLYHTGKQEVRVPDIRHGRKNADFGQGFYLTPDREFSYRWAGKDAVVNEYELEESGLRIHRFSRDEEWFSYILRNRGAVDGLSADVVIGPIANDTIFETFGIISSGYLEPADALRLLRIGPEYIQVALKTEQAASQLRWVGSERITGMDSGSREAEQQAYSAEFARILEEIQGGEE